MFVSSVENESNIFKKPIKKNKIKKSKKKINNSKANKKMNLSKIPLVFFMIKLSIHVNDYLILYYINICYKYIIEM